MTTPIDTSGAQPPLTELQAGAAQLHELFTTYVGSGFSRSEALHLVATALRVALTGGQGGER